MKKIVTLVMVAAFALTAALALAKSDKCTVKEVKDVGEEKEVTLTCKKTKLTAGTKVKVKADKKVEGC